MPAERFLLMQSWWLASLLFRRHPDLKLIETHPGGGLHDCLTLIRNASGVIDINRVGGIRVHAAADFRSLPVGELLNQEDATEYLTALETASGLGSPPHAPASTPAALTFRAIAQLLAITLNTRQRWDVRNVFLDTSGTAGGINDKYLKPFPMAAQRAREKRPDDLHGVPFYRYWAVLRAATPVAILDTDGFAYVGKQVLSLPDIYAAHSSRITPTVAATLGAVLP
jgi:hypothetical protein